MYMKSATETICQADRINLVLERISHEMKEFYMHIFTYYDRINIITWHCRNETHRITNYNHLLRQTNTSTSDDMRT
jgi:hypothetical protein